MNKKNVVIIGAGLSGLAAAYTLSKKEKFNITLLEKNDYLGGRVKSIVVDGYKVDLGGFIVFNWYKNFRRLAKELHIDQYFRPIQKYPIYYQLDPGGDFYSNPIKRIPVTKRLKAGKEIMHGFFRKERFIEKPNLKAHDNKTVEEVLDKLFGEKSNYTKFTDVVSQGYCYPEISKYKMAFLAPFIYKTFVSGDLFKGHSLQGNTSRLPKAMAKQIKIHGGKINKNSKVTKISKDNTVFVGRKKYKADIVIYAQTVGDLYKEHIKKKNDCGYTEFITAVIKMKKPCLVNGKSDWTALFMAPDKSVSYQMLSIVYANPLVPDIGYKHLIVNVKIKKGEKGNVSDKKLFKELSSQLENLFIDNELESIDVREHWEKLMPIAQESFVERIRLAQGKDQKYYTGDYLGSASMETALTTGVKLAHLILKEHG